MAQAAGVGYASRRHSEGQAQTWAKIPGCAAVTTYPDDATLLARGKYSTLTKERRKQLERARDICTAITTASHATLRDCELQPPQEIGPLLTVEKCLENMKDTRERIVKLSTEMLELQKLAWPE